MAILYIIKEISESQIQDITQFTVLRLCRAAVRYVFTSMLIGNSCRDSDQSGRDGRGEETKSGRYDRDRCEERRRFGGARGSFSYL